MRIIDIDKWQEIFQAIGRNKVRTFFTSFGVFYGILMLVLMLSGGNGFKSILEYTIRGISTNSVYIMPRPTLKPYDGLPIFRTIQFHESDIKELKTNISSIENISPIMQMSSGSSDNVVAGDKSGSYDLFGIQPVYFDVSPVLVLSGRLINPFDIEGSRKVVLLGENVASNLYNIPEDAVGEDIKINGALYKIVGVVKAVSDKMNQINGQIVFPITVLQKFMNLGDQIGGMILTTYPDVDAKKLEKDVVGFLKRKYRIHPDDKGGVGSFNMAAFFDKFTQVIRGVEYLIWAVGLGMLLSGVIGIGNIMTIVIKERTQEIGIQRALGATPWRIMNQIILESVILTTVAGFTGMLMGSGIALAAEFMFKKKDKLLQEALYLNIDYESSLMALGLLVIAGLFAGFIPAYNALKIKAIDALRYE
ncbi:MAG: ABC transporter permease [Bacteroidales bacterium]